MDRRKEKRPERKNKVDYDQKTIIIGLSKNEFKKGPPKKGSRYRSEIYKHFDLIYDENDKVITGWYSCKMCDYIIDITLNKSGNKKLYIHKKNHSNESTIQQTTINNDDNIIIKKRQFVKVLAKLTKSRYGNRIINQFNLEDDIRSYKLKKAEKRKSTDVISGKEICLTKPHINSNEFSTHVF